MKIVVLVKRIPDTASVIKIGADKKSIIKDNLKYIINPYDEYAIEEALKIKENSGSEVIILSYGGEENREIIRMALAFGADSGVLINGESSELLPGEPVAKSLAAVIKNLNPDLVLAGKQAVDNDAVQIPEKTAEILKMPHASAVTKIEFNDNKIIVNREIDEGYFTIELPMPALISIEKGINTPRYPTLPNIIKSKKKEIKQVELSDLHFNDSLNSSDFEIEELFVPECSRKNVILKGGIDQDVKSLVSYLKIDEKVI